MASVWSWDGLGSLKTSLGQHFWPLTNIISPVFDTRPWSSSFGSICITMMSGFISAICHSFTRHRYKWTCFRSSNPLRFIPSLLDIKDSPPTTPQTIIPQNCEDENNVISYSMLEFEASYIIITGVSYSTNRNLYKRFHQQTMTLEGVSSFFF